MYTTKPSFFMQLPTKAIVFLATCICSASCFFTQNRPVLVYDGASPVVPPAALLQDDVDVEPAAPLEFVPIMHMIPSSVTESDVLPQHHHRHHAKRHHHHEASKHHYHRKQKKHHRHRIQGAMAFRSQRLRSSKAKHHHEQSWPWAEEDKAVKFGPEGCVETYKNAKGTCVIETKCAEVDIGNYSIELLCVLEDGDKVQHVFGKGSFDAEEELDTLISCRECLGPDEEKAAPKLQGASEKLDALHEEVQELTKTLQDIGTNVNHLSATVFGGGAPSPAPSTFVAAPATAKVSFLDKAEALVEQLSREADAKGKAHSNENKYDQTQQKKHQEDVK